MKKNILINRIRIILLLLLLSVALNSCSIFENLKTTQETYTDPYGKVYYVVNKNYFKFDFYNVLEVIISDTEKFILYDNVDDQKESGIGEWHKNGVVLPVCFDNYARTSDTVHDDIIVMYHESAMAYIDTNALPEMTPFIAKINNDTKKPGINWWISGNYTYNASFGEIKPVEYNMYNRNKEDQWSYIPSQAYDFYNVGDETFFSCQEGNFKWNAMTGKGDWSVNDIDIPIRAWFDVDSFLMCVVYDTGDNRDGQYIFVGRGQSIDEKTATFKIESAPDVYSNDSSCFTIIKITE